ncbi:unnamed protein product [Clonostachys rosea]|uniref:P-loop containing nucleoside triphosphate hydrolase protein n=1 Tax=Bionectria ochroleuca TaxID=29856 RepID=A0ABY6TYS5_BIOOC|nr:unnamed protein product [Clonostachys rosea]
MTVPADLIPLLQRTAEDPRPIVVAMCGVAGSGKSTLSKSIVSKFPTFIRLSIDQIIFDAHGIYGVDYPKELYREYSSEANKKFIDDLRGLLSSDEPRDVVLDRSFYAKDDRDDYRKLAEEMGARFVLVFFDINKDKLWQRIQQRAAGDRNADSAFEITSDILDMYVGGFESPDEDEISVIITG